MIPRTKRPLRSERTLASPPYRTTSTASLQALALSGQPHANLGTQAHRITKRAGFKPWPRTSQNLRANRETKRCDSFPMKSVTEWMGHSSNVANKHCLSIPDEHYEKACALCVQQASAKGQNGGKTEKAEENRNAVIQEGCRPYNSLQKRAKADGGN